MCIYVRPVFFLKKKHKVALLEKGARTQFATAVKMKMPLSSY